MGRQNIHPHPPPLKNALWPEMGGGGGGGVYNFALDKMMCCTLLQEGTEICTPLCRGNESIYLHRSGPRLENGLDRPENCYGRYAFASFSSISISTVGLDGTRVSLRRFSFLALWVVVVDIFQFPALAFSSGDF